MSGWPELRGDFTAASRLGVPRVRSFRQVVVPKYGGPCLEAADTVNRLSFGLPDIIATLVGCAE